ncbi:MAG: hypothetical protein OEZ39_09210 [Gammaproteobacteria bacterium]|nr:hypothetical protein [Gammaproteobacteria bacterium]MDH5652022.1 hypothetical protein [Gammaproteobacteria bacterium]
MTNHHPILHGLYKSLCAGLLLCQSNSILAVEPTGTVCLGSNLAKPYAETTHRLYLRIDKSEKIFFPVNYAGDRVVVKDLALDKKHRVYVYFDDEVVVSWKLDFNKLQTDTVVVWRAAGSWRMDAVKRSDCKDVDK